MAKINYLHNIDKYIHVYIEKDRERGWRFALLALLLLSWEGFLLAEHKIRHTRTICTSVGVPRTRVRRTEYRLKRPESGVSNGGYSLTYQSPCSELCCHKVINNKLH